MGISSTASGVTPTDISRACGHVSAIPTHLRGCHASHVWLGLQSWGCLGFRDVSNSPPDAAPLKSRGHRNLHCATFRPFGRPGSLCPSATEIASATRGLRRQPSSCIAVRFLHVH